MDNLRGAGLMVLAMLCFAIEDMFIKLLGGAIPVGQLLALLGGGGAFIMAGACVRQGQPLVSRALLGRAMLIRNAGEVIGSLGFVTALVLVPLATASAILQTTPLMVTLGAAVFLAEPVGWRRWAAIIVGLCGVLLIVRPGLEGFDWNVLFAVQGMIGLSIRDLATRRVPATLSALQLSFVAFALLVPTGMGLMLASGTSFVAPTANEWGLLAIASVIGAISYRFIVMAMRMGDVSFVTPFRYTRMVFALIIGVLIFSEAPDMLTLIGVAIIIASGLFTLWREHIRKTPDAA
ncbi:DMT family transporter [uncultured Tateyamaria sp.]|uniref:DMT family transporter n=1 Tax=uncultured Tateyamaria sp. TaxID=455651 RepID=UPI00263A0EF5|nr:DMT family transporter [uncultured Tateyamaria sp.]